MITSSLLNTSPSSKLSVDVGKTYAILNTIICNYSSNSTGSVDVFFVKSGATASNINKVISSRTILAGDSMFISEKFILEEGDSIIMSSSINNVYSTTITYTEI